MRPRVALVWVLLLGCGRVGFDATRDATQDATDAPSDGAPLDPALVVYYPFDTAPAPTVPNAAGNAFVAHCAPDCPTAAAGRVGNALHFDGVSQALSLPVTSALDLEAGTLALWMKLDAELVDPSDVALFERPYDTVALNTFELYLHRDGAPTTLVAAGDAEANGNGVEVPISTVGAWVHVAMTWDDVLVRAYVDGVFVGADTALDRTYAPLDALIGCAWFEGTLGFYYAGAIDDVRIYNRALDTAEIAALASP